MLFKGLRTNISRFKQDVPYYHHYIIENIRHSFSKKIKESFSNKEWDRSFENFSNQGIAILPLKLDRILNIFENLFDNDLNIIETDSDNNLLKIISVDDWNDFGKKSIEIDLKSKIFEDIIFDENLHKFLNMTFKSKFWFRNNPLHQIDNQKHRINNSTEGLFHIDNGLRQISIMILLNDIDTSSSHMEYIKESHKDNYYSRVSRHNPKFINKTQRYLKNNKSLKLTGKRGTAYIFDAGNGIHRAVYGTGIRKTIHFNFVNTYAHINFKPINNKTKFLKERLDNASIDFLNKIKKNNLDMSTFRLLF